MTDLNEYQMLAARTAQYAERTDIEVPPLVYLALKLNGEAGEVAEEVGKWLRGDDLPLAGMSVEREERIVKELGDVLWYVSQIARELGYPLTVVANRNLEKLQRRLAMGTIKGNGSDR